MSTRSAIASSTRSSSAPWTRRPRAGSASRTASQSAASSSPSRSSSAFAQKRSASPASSCPPACLRTTRRADSQAVPAAEHLGRAGDLHEPGRQADLLAAQVARAALAVPLLVRLPHRGLHRLAEPDLPDELRPERRVRRQELVQAPRERHREVGDPPGPLRRRPERADAPHEERDRLRRAHVEHLEALALERDVVAEPGRLLRRVGVAVGVHQQAEVVRRLAVLRRRRRPGRRAAAR